MARTHPFESEQVGEFQDVWVRSLCIEAQQYEPGVLCGREGEQGHNLNQTASRQSGLQCPFAKGVGHEDHPDTKWDQGPSQKERSQRAIGFTSGRIPELRVNHVLLKNYSVVGLHWGLYNRKLPELPHRVHAELVALYEAGRIDPLISAVVPMEGAAAALTALGSRHTVGKVVVRTRP